MRRKRRSMDGVVSEEDSQTFFEYTSFFLPTTSRWTATSPSDKHREVIPVAPRPWNTQTLIPRNQKNRKTETRAKSHHICSAYILFYTRTSTELHKGFYAFPLTREWKSSLAGVARPYWHTCTHTKTRSLGRPSTTSFSYKEIFSWFNTINISFISKACCIVNGASYCPSWWKLLIATKAGGHVILPKL